jgi:hypothetical protein
MAKEGRSSWLHIDAAVLVSSVYFAFVAEFEWCGFWGDRPAFSLKLMMSCQRLWSKNATGNV